MTELHLGRNKIGDRGARALAQALKATHVIRFRNTRATYNLTCTTRQLWRLSTLRPREGRVQMFRR